MISVPSFLLRRLYSKGSLKNTAEGFQFQLKNTLGSGFARKLFPVVVDGEEMPLEACFFEIEGKEVPFSEVSPEKPFTLSMGGVSTIKVKKKTLSPGTHRIGFGFEVQGLGRLNFEFTDVVS